MKKIAAVLTVVVLVVSLVSLVFAAEAKKGTIKGVDAKAGTVVFCAEGTTTDTTLHVDKAVDLGKVKAGDKVEIMMDKDMVKEIKAAKKVVVGC